jgi:hypothetical protein
MTTYYPPQNPHYQPPQPPPAAPQPQPKRGRVHWAWLILALFVGIGIGNVGDSSPSQTTASAPTRTAQAPAALQPVPQSQEPAQAPAGPDFSQGIPDGQYIVPDEVAPGRYKSAGAQPGIFELCSVSTKAANGDVIDWKTGNEGDQVLITITDKADTVEIHGCEPFVKVS